MLHSLEYRRRMEMVRNHWTRSERRQRAEIGRRRTADFIVSILDHDSDADAIWAVGSTTLGDVERLR